MLDMILCVFWGVRMADIVIDTCSRISTRGSKAGHRVGRCSLWWTGVGSFLSFVWSHSNKNSTL